MRMSVGVKLWLAFFGTLSLTVFTMYMLLHGTLKGSFLDYTSQHAVQRLQIFQQAVLDIYLEDQGFTKLTQDAERWMALKNIIFSNRAPVDPELIERTPNADSPQRFYREFVNSVSLFDESRNLLMGVVKPGKELSWVPIIHEETNIGFIGFVKPKVVVREADRKYMEHQLTFFSIISAVVLAVSLGVATLLTRRISLPIKALSTYTESLASGDYQQRIDVSSRDEIGQLGNNFNKLAQTLAANERSRVNWIADISHEMRTPVAVLKAQIEAMQDGIRPLDGAGLSLLHQKVVGLNALVDDLFELSLSDIGALSYNKQPLQMLSLVETTVKHHQAKTKAAGLDLSVVSTLKTDTTILADPKRLEQLLTNLLENSVRYSNSGGRIEVALSEADACIVLLVSDSAPTVPQDQRDKIFERLHRLEESRNRNTGGAGLGLAICKNIVEAHQGTIQAEDSSLGGICIRVELPKHV